MKSTRSVTYGAMTLGLIVILMYLNQMFAQVFSFTIGFPLLVYSYEFKEKDGFVVYIASIIITFILGSLPISVLMIGYGAIALVLSYGFRNNQSWIIQYILCLCIGIPLYIITILLFQDFLGIDYQNLVTNFGVTIAILVTLFTLIAEIFIMRRLFILFDHFYKHRK